MAPSPSTSASASEAIGKLCVTADWACARGDLAGLCNVARQLQDYVSEPTHCALVELSATCASHPERAIALWDRIKTSLYRDVRP
jgi:hypothetical protein